MIVVIGNICRDTSYYVDRIPMTGETMNARHIVVGLGGKGLNQAIAAHRCGSQVKLIAGVGDDWTAEDEAQASGNSSGLTIVALRGPGPSDCSSIIVTKTGENLIVTNAAQAERVSIADVEPHLGLNNGDVLVVQGNLQSDVSLHAMERANRCGAPVIFNPAPYSEWAKSVANLVDVLILNEKEAWSWTGERDPAQAILQIAIQLSIITLGSKGCLVKSAKREVTALAAAAAETIDTTGAGDIFVGVFASEWSCTKDHQRALRLALAAASASVSRAGAFASIPSREALDQLRAML
jgi:ribokinase